jgi:hypothetical protein
VVRRSTWILLAALAVVAAAYLGWSRYAPPPLEATPTATPESPWQLAAEQVDSIRISDLSRSVVFAGTRDPEQGWRMLSPEVGGADTGRVEAALAGILAPVIRQSLAAGVALEPYGLAPAQFRVTLLLADGTTHSMDIGRVDPTGSVYYAMLPGDGRVLMVSRFSLEDLLGLVAEPPYPPPAETPSMAPDAPPTP